VKKHPMPTDTVLDVYEREQGCCAVCGLTIGREAGHLHHRRPRGMGGGGGQAHALSNVILLHATCHLTHVELKRDRAYQNGWLLQQWQDPQDSPMMYRLDGWVLLKDSGEIAALEKGGTES